MITSVCEQSSVNWAPVGIFFKTTSLVAKLATFFFEKEEAIRESSNDALRENARKAQQDSNLLHEWILQDWHYVSMEKYQVFLL